LQYVIVRHRGAQAFSLDDAGVVRVCRTGGRACKQRRLQPGTYRFAAVAVDEWGQSVPALSHPVVVRKSRR